MENIVMDTDRLDDDSVVVNFNIWDEESEEIVGDGGYVHVRKEDGNFVVAVFNSDGDVLSETIVPFQFMRHDLV
jgi:hypothetical protein